MYQVCSFLLMCHCCTVACLLIEYNLVSMPLTVEELLCLETILGIVESGHAQCRPEASFKMEQDPIMPPLIFKISKKIFFPLFFFTTDARGTWRLERPLRSPSDRAGPGHAYHKMYCHRNRTNI